MAKTCNNSGNNNNSPQRTFSGSFILDELMYFDEFFDFEPNSTIEDDIAKVIEHEWELGHPTLDSRSDILDIKSEIRNADCMWSGGAGCGNSSNNNNNSNGNASGTNSAASSYSESTAVPPSVVSIKRDPDGDADDMSPNPIMTVPMPSDGGRPRVGPTPVVVVPMAHNYRHQPDRTVVLDSALHIKSELHEDYERHLEKHSILQQQQQSEQHIPPGASLLRKSNNNKHGRRVLPPLEQSITDRFNKYAYVRPDTPHSLYDEATPLPPFHHNVDLRACVMGSNNISLTSAGDTYIDLLSRELQNTSKQNIDLSYRLGIEPSITEVLDVLHQEQQQQQQQSTIDGSLTAAATSTMTALNSDSDSDGEVDADPDVEADDGECSLMDSSCGSAASLDGNNSLFMRHISDHSYTRCKDMVYDGPNIETPSDSDEEIDVVSLNDKKLPTNPSEKDRRALQFQVADKFSNRIVKTEMGVRTLPPLAMEFRRVSFDLPYTPASSSPVKSVANSRYPSPSSTPYQHEPSYSPPSSQSSNDSGIGIPIARLGLKADSSQVRHPRKRYFMTSGSCSLSKYRCKRGKSLLAAVNSTMLPDESVASTGGSNAAASGAKNALKRQFSHNVDEADTIEKRNLHNDMERQRRIGLKNLFEALKKQIPSIKDKERAPKVNILREAAKLCEQLTREEHELSLQRQFLQEKLKRRQDMCARLRLGKADS
ncbi:myc protein [Scaptodrosophila lebanonensis]|uniref:Myc protein n=1 Tax=Drosophila lebanonensis TaxID=7225 RepID=A0A6J2UDW0_DROLE|nr:myc protein [Scaptodrosophila lebanonensis]